ncbi:MULTISPECIES: DNA-3-methyladenine glycosylase [Sphingobacterium]|jgi:DNA-3-methyladenine glycosylase|uniref:Putative 3-methyladenine DNA glycosylase n=1 Tax=Sphingobacterium siyangense TaxID=459529 RepID=A0A562MSZ3_9SPHI|nr:MULTISPECIES: DNA-3-methyladenine glycosylase [Sphingobacterium]APU96964.1 3-methyladenine DNA glycosylase [Sphingobacterium sp. B29]TWI22960.1 DNA-3-methyladenine glycosylase [Sphingobacterium siyangense]
MSKLPKSYYNNTDTLFLAEDLLGKVLYTQKDGLLTGGRIVETEAYFGVMDKASHAFNGKRTSRTEPMYREGGVAYVYLCYGIHHLLNIVTSGAADPQCVLIRSIEPLVGIDVMALRRHVLPEKPSFSNGPGSAAKALGIDASFNDALLTDDRIWIEDQGLKYNPAQIGKAARIGIAYAQEHAALPLRFFVKESKYARK